MSSIWFYWKWSTATLINLFSSVINDNSAGKLSEVPFKTSSTNSYLSFESFFVDWKCIFFLLTFNSIYKYASTTRLKSKTFALKYLGQKSSKLSPKPLVRKLVSLGFCRQCWPWQYFFISGFYLTINTYAIDHSIFPNIMSPGITLKTRSFNHCQTVWM